MSEAVSEAPPGWARLNLFDAVSPRGEKALPADHPAVPFIGMDHVEPHSGRIIGAVPAATMKSAAARFVAGDVLYGRLRPYLNKVAVPSFAGLASAEFIVFPGTDFLSSTYLAYRLRASDFVSFASHLNEGDRPRVDFAQIGTFTLDVPPPREQHRIVAKIEELFSELDKAVESLTLARAQLKTYRQGLLKAAFEGKLTADWRAAEQQWRSTRLGAEIAFLTSGSRGWGDYYASQGDVFIRAQNLKHDRLDLRELAFVQLPPDATEGLRTRVQAGDVLITITGANVTKTGIVNCDLGTAYVSQHVALCRPSASLRSEFLYWYLLSETGGRRQLNAAAYGAGKPGLNLENIREVEMALPSPDEQDEIVARLSARLSEQEHLDQAIQDQLHRIAVLREAILKQAFSGRLVAQNPSDESASVLVSRLREQMLAPRTRRRKTA